MRPDDPSLGPTSIKVGCVNFEAVPRDKAATLAKMLDRIADAADQGCDLVVFPELALNTWSECADCAAAHRPCALAPGAGRAGRRSGLPRRRPPQRRAGAST